MFLLEGGGGLFAAGWQLPRHRVANVWAPHHALGYRLSGIATITRKCGGEELRRVPPIGSVTFSPGDRPTEWASDAAVEAIHVYIAAAALDGCRIRDFFGVADPWLDAYFRLLAAECAPCDEESPVRSLFLDQTEQLLLRHLARRYSDSTGVLRERMRVSPLPRGVTRHIEDYIAANLDQDISLHRLAGIAHMSVDHFVRAFRSATGKTPHRFVLDQRLEHAAAMLRAEPAAIAEVARSCGFRSAAHFSVRFHARFGLPPSQYRRSA